MKIDVKKIKRVGKNLFDFAVTKLDNINADSALNKLGELKGKVEEKAVTIAEKLNNAKNEILYGQDPFGQEFVKRNETLPKDNNIYDEYRHEVESVPYKYYASFLLSFIDAEENGWLFLTEDEFDSVLNVFLKWRISELTIGTKKISLVLAAIEEFQPLGDKLNYNDIMTIISLPDNEVDEYIRENLAREIYDCEAAGLTESQKRHVNYIIDNGFNDGNKMLISIVWNIIHKLHCLSKDEEEYFDKIIKAINCGIHYECSEETCFDILSDENKCEEYLRLKRKEKQADNERRNSIKKLRDSIYRNCDNKVKLEILKNFVNVAEKNDLSIEKIKEIISIILSIPEDKINNDIILYAEDIFLNHNIMNFLKNDKAAEYIELVFNSKSTLTSTVMSYALCGNNSFTKSPYLGDILANINSIIYDENMIKDEKLMKLIIHILHNIDFNFINRNIGGLNDKADEIIITLEAYIDKIIKGLCNLSELRQTDEEYIYRVLMPFIVAQLHLFRNVEKVNPSIKIYDDYYEIPSYKTNVSPTPDLEYFISASDNLGNPELSSTYLIHKETGTMLIYYCGKEFGDKMQKIIEKQENPVIICTPEILEKYADTFVLIAKYKGRYCNLPTARNLNIDGNKLIVTLADKTKVVIDAASYEIISKSSTSEIMNDISRQILEDQGRKLKLF